MRDPGKTLILGVIGLSTSFQETYSRSVFKGVTGCPGSFWQHAKDGAMNGPLDDKRNRHPMQASWSNHQALQRALCVRSIGHGYKILHHQKERCLQEMLRAAISLKAWRTHVTKRDQLFMSHGSILMNFATCAARREPASAFSGSWARRNRRARVHTAKPRVCS